LKLKYDDMLSNVAFEFDLRHHSEAFEPCPPAAAAADPTAGSALPQVGRCRLKRV